MSRLSGVLPQGRAAGGTVTTAAPAASAPGGGAYGEFRSGLGDVTSGRVSLLMLDTLILFLIVFYVWTHRVQGGG
jgi:hypothetical protein